MTNEGYIRLTDICDVKEAELIEICPGMKKGMAKRILTMAKFEASLVNVLAWLTSFYLL
jgi:hypothetical protein